MSGDWTGAMKKIYWIIAQLSSGGDITKRTKTYHKTCTITNFIHPIKCKGAQLGRKLPNLARLSSNSDTYSSICGTVNPSLRPTSGGQILKNVFGGERGQRRTLGAVSSTFGLFSISHNPSLKPFLLLGLAYLSLLGWYGKISFGPRNALFERRLPRTHRQVTLFRHSSNIYALKETPSIGAQWQLSKQNRIKKLHKRRHLPF